MERFYASYRQALFPAAGMARKVIVACLNVTVLAGVGGAALGGSPVPVPRARRAPVHPPRTTRKPPAARGERTPPPCRSGSRYRNVSRKVTAEGFPPHAASAVSVSQIGLPGSNWSRRV